jgi:hypothetical protein
MLQEENKTLRDENEFKKKLDAKVGYLIVFIIYFICVILK